MADINPNISGSTVDPKWIDGGPENPEPTFNIDDPTFSLPMPVMSGLASGFCERAAVVYGGTVGGQPWDNATSAAKANTVSCLAANLALGTVPNASMTNMFVSANTDFMPTKYNTTSNYMRGLDNMLTKLISAPGGYVRNVTGTDPTAFTFTTLANDARSRSALPSVGSSATSVGSGGASYTSRFMPALPVVYPIHRKWMMDELKYTEGGTVSSSLADAAGNFSELDDADWLNAEGKTAASAYNELIELTPTASWTIASNLPKTYYSDGSSSGYQDAEDPYIGVPMSATMSATTDSEETESSYVSSGHITSGFVSSAFVSNGYITSGYITSADVSYGTINGEYVEDIYVASGSAVDAYLNSGYASNADVSDIYVSGSYKEYGVHYYFKWAMRDIHHGDYEATDVRVFSSGAIMYLETPAALSTDVNVNVYLDHGAPLYISRALPSAAIVTAASTATPSITLYKVYSGGALTISSGVAIDNAVVADGGVINISNGGYLRCCTVLSGGSVTGIKNVETLNEHGVFPTGSDYGVAAPVGSSFKIISGSNSSEFITNETAAFSGPSSYYVTAGGKLIISAAYAEVKCNLYNVGSSEGTKTPMERIIIDSGGQVLVKGTPTPRQIYIQSGTENNSITMSYTRNPFLDSAVQGSQYYCWYRDPNNTYTQLGSSIFTNTLQFTSGESGYIDPIYSQPGTVINNWTLVADTVHAWDQVAHLDCNITVLSGGTFTQGLAAQMGYWRYDYNVDNSHKEFRAYPGAVVIIERRNGYSDSFEDSYNVNISNETDLTFYRITSSSTIEPYSVYYYGIPYATICVTSNFSSNSAEWPNIQNITGATWSDYAEQTDPFAVHSEPVRESRSFVPGVYPNYMQIVNSGFTVKLFNNMGLAQYQYVSSGGQEPEPIPLQYGLNVIPVAFNTLTGITCITDYGEALYTKTETAGTWAKDISGGASLPATLYTSADSPISGDAVYSDSAKVTSVGVVRGFDYPLISGSTVTIQDSPTMGAFYSYDGADLLYRCSIADMVVITANGGAVSHYKEFRVRQFYEDPGKLY